MTREIPHRTRWMRYVWLVYLGALAFQPAFDPASGIVDWLVVGVLVAIFVPLYLLCFHTDQRGHLLIVAGMAALGLVGSLWNSGAGVFLIYAAAAAAWIEPPRRAIQTIAALVGVVGIMFLISPVPYPWRWFAILSPLIFTIIIGATNFFEAERERAQRRLRRADEEIERLATLAERERIARDLHDLLGHTLSVIVVKSELAARLSQQDPGRARDEMQEVEQIGRGALSEVRSAVAGYRARGLHGELEGARRALAAAGVDTSVEAELPALPIAHESALALALREGVTNVVRHAGAAHATIGIEADGDRIVLQVTDDGRGSATPEGAGLTGMRERIAALGGTVERGGATQAGAGTSLRVTLPLDAPPSAARAPAAESPQHP